MSGSEAVAVTSAHTRHELQVLSICFNLQPQASTPRHVTHTSSHTRVPACLPTAADN